MKGLRRVPACDTLKAAALGVRRTSQLAIFRVSPTKSTDRGHRHDVFELDSRQRAVRRRMNRTNAKYF